MRGEAKHENRPFDLSLLCIMRELAGFWCQCGRGFVKIDRISDLCYVYSNIMTTTFERFMRDLEPTIRL